MDKSVADKLLRLNHEFYQTFAIQFSDTRGRLQPGVSRILEAIDLASRILDLGCGNGEFACELERRGFCGQYLGLDLSAGLLDKARSRVKECSRNEAKNKFAFFHADLSQSGWTAKIQDFRPTLIVAFASLHHLPGRELHLQTLQEIRRLLAPGGKFIHSNWQFLNSERLRQRLHPWPEIGLTPEDVEPSDYLLDWRRGGFGLRYVHHFSESELCELAEETGFRVTESFYSDGESGDLGLYQIWEADNISFGPQTLHR